MKPEQEKRAAELFECVVELPPDQREAMLAERAAAETEIVARVRELLAALDESDWTIEPSLPDAGDVIGPYRLEERIGEGGFGVVFRATREVGETRTAVAIKFLNVEMAGAEARARFDFERQTLAELDHPGIARLLDGGTTAKGVAYLVMEHVDGKAINRFCDERRLGISARLELLIQICEAVEYAHRRQLLHRDLKPANILVNSSGQVKLLDFGIAKLTSQRATPLSAPGQKLFSLSHASPEQLRGEPLTVATDIYSLGVIFYEVVCGHLPFPAQALWDLAAAQTSRQREPMRPSRAVFEQEGAVDPESVSTARETRPRHLQRLLEGDLDAVVLTALRPLPSERYSSVDALRFDVERFLGGWPVEARTPSLFDRLRKWVRRNPATAAMLACALLLALWGMRSATVPYVRFTELSQRNARLESVAERLLDRDLYLAGGALDGPALRELVAEHIRFLKAVDSLPMGARIHLDQARLTGWTEAAEGQWRSGDRTAAEASMTTAVDGFAAMLGTFPGDSAIRQLYRKALAGRMRYRSELNMTAGAQQDRARILALDGGRIGP